MSDLYDRPDGSDPEYQSLLSAADSAEATHRAAAAGRDQLHAQLLAVQLRLAAAVDPGLLRDVMFDLAGLDALKQQLDHLNLQIAEAMTQLQEVREMAAAVIKDFDQLEVTRDRLIYDVRRLRSQKARLEGQQ